MDTAPAFTAVLFGLRGCLVQAANGAPSPAPGARASGKGLVKGRGMSIMLRDNGYWACAAHVAVMPESGPPARAGFRRGLRSMRR